ncbi:MAG: phosphoribosylanthranilate isomerase [Lachnospiraceae bacterium]|nr:phosphoribosylanthranilate isomerase [Lachnospiraceae bacterium]MBR3762131.1 phosphoribosylanthranilate isomerase [Lachnospiraceae bacterium]
MKQQAFFENAILLTGKLKIIPLIYGSLGLEYITGESLNADDIDILIPGVFVNERWNEFKSVLLDEGYTLFDEHEHTFQKNGICYSYASIEELESFAGISLSEIKEHNKDGIRFRVLSLEQYLKVYVASAKDGYRITVRKKKDGEKIAFIQKHLELSLR